MVSPSIVFLRVKTIKRWGQLRPYRDIPRNDFETEGEERSDVGVTFGKIGPFDLGRQILNSNYKKSGVLHFLSHRWSTPSHPDPDGAKVALIADEFPDEALIWLDYSCLPQEPRTADEQLQFIQGLKAIPDLIRRSWFTVIGENLIDYDLRCWCQFEALCALQYGSTPRTASFQGQSVEINSHTKNLKNRSPAFSSFIDCLTKLPKDELPKDGVDIGSGLTQHGYYLDVPDLNGEAFCRFREMFLALAATDPTDPPRLLELLRELFPSRRLDFTGIRY